MKPAKIVTLDYEDEMDIDAYFSKPYVPLSNLPTPPLSSQSNGYARECSPGFQLGEDEILDPELLGPAIHLSNLIPPTTSLITPSTTLIHALLCRAALPSLTIALAAIFLDSLNSRFALTWRRSLATTLLSFPPTSSTSKQPLHPYDSPPLSPTISIDTLRPELLPFSAIILAIKFLDDHEVPSSYYASCWGGNIWTTEQLNVAQRVVGENLGWRFLSLCDSGLVADAEGHMRRAGEAAGVESLRRSENWKSKKNRRFGQGGGGTVARMETGWGKFPNAGRMRQGLMEVE